MKFSEKCRRLRAERGWTQEELAQACFVSRSAVSKWETDAGYPDIENLKQLAALAGTTIDELISEEDLANRRQMDRRRADRRLYAGGVFQQNIAAHLRQFCGRDRLSGVRRSHQTGRPFGAV